MMVTPGGVDMCMSLAAVWPTFLQRRSGINPRPRALIAECLVAAFFPVFRSVRGVGSAEHVSRGVFSVRNVTTNFAWCLRVPPCGRLFGHPVGRCCVGLPRARWPLAPPSQCFFPLSVFSSPSPSRCTIPTTCSRHASADNLGHYRCASWSPWRAWL